jgi:hypothetical protein
MDAAWKRLFSAKAGDPGWRKARANEILTNMPFI